MDFNSKEMAATLTDRDMKRIEKMRVSFKAVVAICAGAAGIIAFLSGAWDFVARIVPERSPRLIQLSLSTNSFGYEETIEGRFGVQDEKLRTFKPKYPFVAPPALVVTLTVQNPRGEELLITSGHYRVSEVGQVKSLTPGPIEPTATYTNRVPWSVGTHESLLVPVYRIPDKTTGSFSITLLPQGHVPLGAGMVMTIVLNTNMGPVESDEIQIFLPVGKERPDIPSQKQARSRIGKSPDEIQLLIDASRLTDICDSENFDLLDKDLMFYKASTSSYPDFSEALSSRSGKAYGEIFPQENLRYFWANSQRLGTEP